ncbi:Uncharacterised protein [uncultured Comamonas sp.]|nr:Uncharacterised protein [uncultured Comamonas sp.]
MTIEKQTHLHSVEILLSAGAVQAAWHTNIVEDGQVIAGPTIHRCAYKVTSADVLPADVLAHVSTETLAALIEHCRQEAEAENEI